MTPAAVFGAYSSANLRISSATPEAIRGAATTASGACLSRTARAACREACAHNGIRRSRRPSAVVMISATYEAPGRLISRSGRDPSHRGPDGLPFVAAEQRDEDG